jgi:hypothetical protein
MIDQKKMGQCVIFQLSGYHDLNDARCTCEIKSRIAHDKSCFQQEVYFHKHTGHKFNKEISKCATLGA